MEYKHAIASKPSIHVTLPNDVIDFRFSAEDHENCIFIGSNGESFDENSFHSILSDCLCAFERRNVNICIDLNYLIMIYGASSEFIRSRIREVLEFMLFNDQSPATVDIIMESLPEFLLGLSEDVSKRDILRFLLKRYPSCRSFFHLSNLALLLLKEKNLDYKTLCKVIKYVPMQKELLKNLESKCIQAMLTYTSADVMKCLSSLIDKLGDASNVWKADITPFVLLFLHNEDVNTIKTSLRLIKMLIKSPEYARSFIEEDFITSARIQASKTPELYVLYLEILSEIVSFASDSDDPLIKDSVKASILKNKFSSLTQTDGMPYFVKEAASDVICKLIRLNSKQVISTLRSDCFDFVKILTEVLDNTPSQNVIFEVLQSLRIILSAGESLASDESSINPFIDQFLELDLLNIAIKLTSDDHNEKIISQTASMLIKELEIAEFRKKIDLQNIDCPH